MTNGSLMKVESIAVAPAIPLTCIKWFRLENLFESGRFTQDLL